jgi:heme A synthase
MRFFVIAGIEIIILVLREVAGGVVASSDASMAV